MLSHREVDIDLNMKFFFIIFNYIVTAQYIPSTVFKFLFILHINHSSSSSHGFLCPPPLTLIHSSQRVAPPMEVHKAWHIKLRMGQALSPS